MQILKQLTEATPMYMKGSPVKKEKDPETNKYKLDADGNIKTTPITESWLLLKLYEATINPGVSYTMQKEVTDPFTHTTAVRKGLDRSELVKRCGTALQAAGQSSTFFNLWRLIGLAFVEDGMVFPGIYLKDWTEGKIKGLPVPNAGKSFTDPYHFKFNNITKKYDIPLAAPLMFGGGVDLTRWLGDTPDKKTPASSRTLRADGTGFGEDPFLQFPGIKPVAPLSGPVVKSDTDPQPKTEPAVAPTPAPTAAPAASTPASQDSATAAPSVGRRKLKFY